MSRVRSVKNQYRGINAHLHSLFQSEGGWNNFHSRHIVHIADTLQEVLVPLGYITRVEQSLQIRRLNDTFRPRADILIADTKREHAVQSPALSGTMTLVELFEQTELDERRYPAIGIYELEEADYGEPIAWIELLSPSNKGDSDEAKRYRNKRFDLIWTGLVFIEIDYLHEAPPTFPSLPPYKRYPSSSEFVQPYHIVVVDSRPDFDSGTAWVKRFGVDDAVPIVPMPLTRGHIIDVDFGVPYQITYRTSAYGLQVDYSQLPRNFDRYLPHDQHRIALRMLSVMEAAREGVDVETGPFRLREDLSLMDALVEIEAIKAKL